MDAALGVDQLGDVDIAGYRNESVGVVAGDVRMVWVLFGEKGNHISDGHLGGRFEVFIEAHCDVLGGSFCAGPDEAVGIAC